MSEGSSHASMEIDEHKPVRFEARGAGEVHKHDHVFIKNTEYTVIQVYFGCNSGKRIIVAQNCNGEKIEMLLNRTDVIHACTQNGPKKKQSLSLGEK